MKNYIIVTLFFINIAITVSAQTTGSVRGKLLEKNSPLEFVDVLLSSAKDTTRVLNYAITDSAGVFIMDKVAFGDYKLITHIIGYKTVSKSVTVKKENPKIDLGSIVMEIDAVELGQVTISASALRKTIQQAPESFVINVASNITQAGGTATDLLRSTPTVNVDAEGAISLRGKTPLILINGRNSSLSNTDQIAASSVESIEIINNPSAKYDASAESGIINIKLKKNKQIGTNGAFAAGAGLGAKGRVNSMALLNHKTQKWNLDIAYDNRFAGRTRNIESARTNFNIPEEYQLNQDRHDKRTEQLQNLKLNTDFSPDEKNLFSFEAIGNLEGQDNHESLNNALLKQDNMLNSQWNRYSVEIERTRVAEFALNYNRKFADERRSFSAGVNTSFERFRQNTDIITHTLDENKAFIGDPTYGRTHDYENANVANAVADYTLPITSNSVIGVGYKGLFRVLHADYQTSEKAGDVYVIDKRVSNVFNFNEQVHATYIQYSGFIGDKDNPRWRYDGGIRAEMVYNKGNTQDDNTAFKNNYVHFFPSANLIFYLKPDEFWKLSYGKRINYPSSGQLSPFVDITDSLNQHSGNPHLKPEIIQSVELGYTTDWKKSSLSSVLFYRYSQDVIKSYSELNSEGIILSKPMNFGSAVTYGLENIFTAHPFAFYDVNLSLSLFRQKINGVNVEQDASNDAFSWYGKMINNFAWKQSKLQLTGNYNAPTVTPQGKNIATYYIDFGFQQQLGQNIHIGLVATDIFNTLKSGSKMQTSEFVSHRTMKADTRAVLLTFAYTFNSAFKAKLLENKFSTE